MEKLEGFFRTCITDDASAVPVGCFFVRPVPAETVAIVRLATSRTHRSAGYECNDFYKPVSRPLPRSGR
jgi:hypothetical protein